MPCNDFEQASSSHEPSTRSSAVAREADGELPSANATYGCQTTRQPLEKLKSPAGESFGAQAVPGSRNQNW